MSDFQHRPGSGTLFKNESDNPKAPAYRGELCLDDGTVLKLAGWVKDGRKGKFLSLAIDKPREDSFRGAGGGGGGDVRSGGSARGSDPFDDPDAIPFISLNSIW